MAMRNVHHLEKVATVLALSAMLEYRPAGC